MGSKDLFQLETAWGGWRPTRKKNTARSKRIYPGSRKRNKKREIGTTIRQDVLEGESIVKKGESTTDREKGGPTIAEKPKEDLKQQQGVKKGNQFGGLL